MKNNASILVVSMIILSIILIMGLNLSLISVRESRLSQEATRSEISYQIADMGVEEVMQKLLNENKSLTLASVFGTACSEGRLLKSSEVGNYEISFFKNSGTSGEIEAACSDIVGNISSIKSSGVSGTENRAVKVPVFQSAACTPLTCSQTGSQCGVFPNGCGGEETITCPCLNGGEICYNGNCCTPKTCGELGCGTYGPNADTCGTVIDCTTSCSGSQVCYNGTCCTPQTCDQLGCGTHGPSVATCGTTIDCTEGCCTDNCSVTGKFCDASGQACTCNDSDCNGCLDVNSCQSCPCGCVDGICIGCPPGKCWKMLLSGCEANNSGSLCGWGDCGAAGSRNQGCCGQNYCSSFDSAIGRACTPGEICSRRACFGDCTGNQDPYNQGCTGDSRPVITCQLVDC